VNKSFEATILFTGNGEEECLAVDEKSFETICDKEDRLEVTSLDQWKLICHNPYHKGKSGEWYFNLGCNSDLLDLFPAYSRQLAGYKMKVEITPIQKDEILSGWFGEEEYLESRK
jgi:hypothetical protein